MYRYLFIINPVAGNRQWEVVKHIFDNMTEKLVNIRYDFSLYPGHAYEITVENKDKFDVIIAVGGDGTVHEIVNGLGEDSKNIFGMLPIGSGNDFARMTKMTSDFKTNLNILLKAKHVKYFDIPKISFSDFENPDTIKSQYFINSLGIGFDAYVAFLAKENVLLKGILRYLYAVMKALVKYNPLNLEADFDGRIFSGKKLLVTIGNGKTAGGGFYLNPKADPEDGLLNSCFADNFSIIKILRFLPLAVFGRHIKKPGVTDIEFRKAIIKLKEPAYMHMEGEIGSKNLKEISIELCQNRLPVIVS